MPSPQRDHKNRLLSLMSAEDFALVAPELQRQDFRKGHVMVEAGAEVDFVHFPESGMGSVLAATADGEECETGLFGHEGAGPYCALLGVPKSIHRVVIQVADNSCRIARPALVRCMDQSATLRDLLLRFVYVMNVQASLTALINATRSVDQRLARWILMFHDRSEGDELALTHEFLSIMLAVRRPSVTTALHTLEGSGLIRCERGFLTVRNRAALESFAGAAYGQPEAEYRRLIGPMR